MGADSAVALCTLLSMSGSRPYLMSCWFHEKTDAMANNLWQSSACCPRCLAIAHRRLPLDCHIPFGGLTNVLAGNALTTARRRCRSLLFDHGRMCAVYLCSVCWLCYRARPGKSNSLLSTVFEQVADYLPVLPECCYRITIHYSLRCLQVPFKVRAQACAPRCQYVQLVLASLFTMILLNRPCRLNV